MPYLMTYDAWCEDWLCLYYAEDWLDLLLQMERHYASPARVAFLITGSPDYGGSVVVGVKPGWRLELASFESIPTRIA